MALNYDDYVNTLPYPSGRSRDWTDEQRAAADAYRNREQEANRQFEGDLRTHLGCDILPDSVWSMLYRLAWENGHASGLPEVAIHADDLADIARAAFTAGMGIATT